MDLTVISTVPGITLFLTFIGVLVIGAFKAYERINAPGSSETWDKSKFGIFVVVVAGIMLIMYATDGGISFPADDIIQVGISMTAPIFALFGLAYTTIVAGKIVKNDVVVPIVASVKTSAAKKSAGELPSGDINWLAMMVTPTYRYGVSPLHVDFKLYGTQPTSEHPGIASVTIDWTDGVVQTAQMVNGEATTDHTFTFVKNDKYTGHTFYPIFTINGSDGSKKMFNVDGKGVEIWVQSA